MLPWIGHIFQFIDLIIFISKQTGLRLKLDDNLNVVHAGCSLRGL